MCSCALLFAYDGWFVLFKPAALRIEGKEPMSIADFGNGATVRHAFVMPVDGLSDVSVKISADQPSTLTLSYKLLLLADSSDGAEDRVNVYAEFSLDRSADCTTGERWHRVDSRPSVPQEIDGMPSKSGCMTRVRPEGRRRPRRALSSASRPLGTTPLAAASCGSMAYASQARCSSAHTGGRRISNRRAPRRLSLDACAADLRHLLCERRRSSRPARILAHRRLWILPAVGFLVLVAGFYFYVWATCGGNPMRGDPGWNGWWDQSNYLKSATALAHGNLQPSQHWYPLGYALLGAPFVYVTPVEPFLIPNLALLLCFCLLYLLIFVL